MLLEIPGDRDGNILMYGHLDKQPRWKAGMMNWVLETCLKDEKLYGRGGADDGHALFASVGSILALKDRESPSKNRGSDRILRESGSPDLPLHERM